MPSCWQGDTQNTVVRAHGSAFADPKSHICFYHSTYVVLPSALHSIRLCGWASTTPPHPCLHGTASTALPLCRCRHGTASGVLPQQQHLCGTFFAIPLAQHYLNSTACLAPSEWPWHCGFAATQKHQDSWHSNTTRLLGHHNASVVDTLTCRGSCHANFITLLPHQVH